MSRVEDLRKALACGRPEHVPVWELEFHLWNAFSRMPVVLGTEFAALTQAEQDRTLHTNAEAMVTVAEELGFAAISVPNYYWEVAPGHPAFYWLPERVQLEQMRILKSVVGEKMLLAAESGGVMSMPAATNYVDFSYRLFDAPEEIDQQAKATLKHGIERTKILRDVGIEMIFSASDIADNHGVFFNPEQMERFILPYVRQWADAVRAAGGWSVLHTDGNLNSCIEALAETGLHALQAIDPVAGMDMLAIQKQVAGRLCLCGNVDCGLLLTGSPENVYMATRELLGQCTKNGGWVLGASNAVQPEVPKENYLAMLKAWKDVQ